MLQQIACNCNLPPPSKCNEMAVLCRPISAQVAEPAVEEAPSTGARRLPADFGNLSYSAQYDHLFASMPLDVRKPVPKPSPEAQRVRSPVALHHTFSNPTCSSRMCIASIPIAAVLGTCPCQRVSMYFIHTAQSAGNPLLTLQEVDYLTNMNTTALVGIDSSHPDTLPVSLLAVGARLDASVLV